MNTPTPTVTNSADPARTPNAWLHSDRRKHRRFGVERPGKVFRRSTQQFAPANSRDLSFSGALLEVETSRPFAIGEIVDVGIAMRREPVVPVNCMVQAIVVRTWGGDAINDARQTVGLRYINAGAANLVS